MMNAKEFKHYEELGIDVLAVDNEGEIIHQSTYKPDTCNSCSSLRLLPDRDPYDSFCDTDQKAICSENNKLISCSMNVWEAGRVGIPSWCPKKQE